MFLAGCAHKGVQGTVWVGAIEPLSGPNKSAGEHAVNGITLALEDVNKEGQEVAGRTVAARYPSNHSNPVDDQRIAVRVIKTSATVALLAGVDAFGADNLGAVVQNYKVPLVTPADPPGQPGGAYVFHTGVSPARRGRLLARFAAGDPIKAKNVTILTAPPGDRGGTRNDALVESFTKEWDKSGGHVHTEAFKQPADLPAILERLQAAPPQAVLLAGTAQDLVDLGKARPGLDVKLPVLFGGEAGELRPGPTDPLPHAVYAVTAFVLDPDLAPAREFARRYRKSFNEDPDIHAVAAYDNARLLFEAMRRADALEGPRIRESLAGLKDYHGVTGPVAFKDQWAVRRAFVVCVRQGKTTTAARYEP